MSGLLVADAVMWLARPRQYLRFLNTKGMPARVRWFGVADLALIGLLLSLARGRQSESCP